MRLHGYEQLLEDNPQTDTEPNIPFNLAIQQGKTKRESRSSVYGLEETP